MSEPDKPPLPAIVFEQIAQLQHKVDRDHWPVIASFLFPIFVPLSEPVPPRAPQTVLSHIRTYASMLFKAEADRYQQFENDSNYRFWLTNLEARVLARVLDAVEKIDGSVPRKKLLIHGFGLEEMTHSLREMLWELGNHYAWKAQSKPAPAPAKTEVPEVPHLNIETQPALTDRQALRDSYRATFPDAGIMDICWAAKQHYREWARWLKGELKDGSKPDRAFRHVLLSGKAPSELRRETRPKNWK
jgi:hypothetical protein